MRHAAGQLTDTFHLLRLMKLTKRYLTFTRALDDTRFQFLITSSERIASLDEVSDVGRRTEPAVNFFVWCPHRYRTHFEPAVRAVRTTKARVDI